MKTFGIIGLGFISTRHMKAIQETGNQLIWGCDIDERTEEKLPEGTPFYEGVQEMIQTIDLEAPDYVVIATPNDLHVKQAKEMLALFGNKVKLIIEKPIAITKQDYKEICTLENLLEINVVMQLRYSDYLKERRGEFLEKENFKAAYQTLVHRGEWYFNEGCWKANVKRSGGLVYNIGVHYFDLLTWCLGSATNTPLESSERHCRGILDFGVGKGTAGPGRKGCARWELSIEQPRDKQVRKLVVDDEEIDLIKLGFEDLHTKCYEQILIGNGVRPSHLNDTMKLLQEITGQ